MKLFFWLLAILVILAAVFLGALWMCFYLAFYASRKEKHPEEYSLPKGKIYEPYHEQMLVWMKETEGFPCQEMEITSFDGLKLKGKFYKYSDTAPIEIMFPGYRGDARRDFCGAAQRCFALEHSALIVDQRACGQSEGHVISFGVNESRDCRMWIDHVIQTLGPDVKIILTGISMGAATVLITAGMDLPKNVVGVLADCGYSSAEAIIKKVIKVDMKLPVKIMYPLVRLAGKVYGGFDIEDATPNEAMKKCKVPVLLAHGDNDVFVPCTMSQENYENCQSEKKLVLVPGAGHCLCYPVDIKAYLGELKEFWERMKIYE